MKLGIDELEGWPFINKNLVIGRVSNIGSRFRGVLSLF